MSPQVWIWIAIVPLLAWLYYRRMRRFIGRQPIRTRRMLVRVGILSLVLIFFGQLVLHRAVLLGDLGGGVAVGAVLGFIGLRLTRIEVTAEGDFYTPNSWLGIAVVALLIGRLVYKFAVLMPQMQHSMTAGVPHAGTASSPMLALYTQHPLTLLIYGIVIGYYLAYFGGLLIHHRRVLAKRASHSGA